MPEFFKSALIAINHLPVTEDTLWLRLLGRGATQQQAVNELAAFPEGHFLEELSGAICALLLRTMLTQTQQRFAIAPMSQFPSEDLTHLLLTLSRKELLERFGE